MLYKTRRKVMYHYAIPASLLIIILAGKKADMYILRKYKKTPHALLMFYVCMHVCMDVHKYILSLLTKKAEEQRSTWK